ncbi:unnamed protein product [Phytophthora fragariaefolia]|uniref:Unnamed protein product n=1 Tax=Phytophthora fragariaefolia TaxID=1490495 RepID=A0A9W6XX57_9STRA|nr:unnamed protein product [Phytophthora fragariaefolia]
MKYTGNTSPTPPAISSKRARDSSIDLQDPIPGPSPQKSGNATSHVEVDDPAGATSTAKSMLHYSAAPLITSRQLGVSKLANQPVKDNDGETRAPSTYIFKTVTERTDDRKTQPSVVSAAQAGVKLALKKVHLKTALRGQLLNFFCQGRSFWGVVYLKAKLIVFCPNYV